MSSIHSGEIKERIPRMRTVKSLIEELARFPDEALCHAYEGVIHCSEREGAEPETELLKGL